MSEFKTVQQIFNPPPPHMVGDGFRVHNFFPTGLGNDYHRMSPFFLMDYGSKIEFPPSDKPRGVGVHPHRGFETVTIAFHGKVAHHDSMGNSGVIGEGDVQWMTAGSGILHKEYHEKEFSQNGGIFQMVQLWVNLPSFHKMTTPKYQDLKNENLGKYFLAGNQGVVEVIAGEYLGIKGPASTFSPLNLFTVRLKKGGNSEFEFKTGSNTGLLLVEGNVKINGKENANADQFVLFSKDGVKFSATAIEDSVFLILNGEPINEPVVPYGPFLMNSKEEIIQAIDDLNSGKFGYLQD